MGRGARARRGIQPQQKETSAQACKASEWRRDNKEYRMYPAPITSNTLRPSLIPAGRAKGFYSEKVLVDGHGAFHCAEPTCDYTSDRWHSVASHRRVHTPRRLKSAQPVQPSDPGQIIRAALDMISVAVTVFEEQPDPREGLVDGDWKKRALDAEKKLRSLRRALGVEAAS